jgi:hypothetical protein
MPWSDEQVDTLVVGAGDGTATVTISDNTPPELQAFYSGFYGATTTRAYIRMQPDSNDYHYEVVMTVPPSGVAHADGWVISGVVKEARSTFYIPTAPVGQKTQENFLLRNSSGYCAFGQLGAVNLGTVFFQDINISWNHSTQPNADFTIDGISQGRGVLYSEAATFSTATGAVAGVEALVYTSAGTFTLKNGRAALVTVAVQAKSGAVQNFIFRIRQNNLAGVTLVDGARIPITTAGTDRAAVRQGIILNTSGADVTLALALTAVPQVATAVTVEAGAGAFAGLILVEDKGSTAQITGWVSVV